MKYTTKETERKQKENIADIKQKLISGKQYE